MKPMSTKELVNQAIDILKDHGQSYAEDHEMWLVSTGIHPEYAEAIIILALNAIKLEEEYPCLP